jgi:hypothetical protein
MIYLALPAITIKRIAGPYSDGRSAQFFSPHGNPCSISLSLWGCSAVSRSLSVPEKSFLTEPVPTGVLFTNHIMPRPLVSHVYSSDKLCMLIHCISMDPTHVLLQWATLLRYSLSLFYYWSYDPDHGEGTRPLVFNRLVATNLQSEYKVIVCYHFHQVSLYNFSISF